MKFGSCSGHVLLSPCIHKIWYNTQFRFHILSKTMRVFPWLCCDQLGCDYVWISRSGLVAGMEEWSKWDYLSWETCIVYLCLQTGSKRGSPLSPTTWESDAQSQPALPHTFWSSHHEYVLYLAYCSNWSSFAVPMRSSTRPHKRFPFKLLSPGWLFGLAPVWLMFWWQCVQNELPNARALNAQCTFLIFIRTYSLCLKINNVSPLYWKQNWPWQ